MFSIKFFKDVILHDGTYPCERHPFNYETLKEAERIARKLLPGVRIKHGATVGFVITDEATGIVWGIGPGTYETV